MRNYQAKLIRINKIAGMLYRSKKVSKTLVIYGLGAPVLPDSGQLPDAANILSFDVDLLVPDYIGYGRSDGICSPINCIKTFLNLYEEVNKGCYGLNNYEKVKTKLSYERVILIGRSFGGTYMSLLPKYNTEIKEIGIIYPAVDNKSSGSMPPEESNEDFMRAMIQDGYHHLYRGILSKTWRKHLDNEDGLSPMDNISFLKNAKLFIGHGKKDECISYKKSVLYYDRIIHTFPDRKSQFKINLYNSGHNFKTSNLASRDFLIWLGVGKYKD